MELQIFEQTIKTVTVEPVGRVDAFTAPNLREQLRGFLNVGVTRFIIDLSKTEFLDSAGMAVLVSTLKAARANDGDVKLVWPEQDAAIRIIKLTKFDRVFDICNSAEIARQKFN